jgi:thiol peroxidase
MAKITLKNNPVNTNGNLPALGNKAPSFSLVASDLSEKTLESFGSKRKIIYTVPSLDTPVCMQSAKHFSEQVSKAPNVVVVVVSADLPFAQGRVCGSENIKNIHTLSMVRSKKFAEDYGVLIVDGPLQGLTARAIIVLDEDNKVIYTELVSEITHEPKYDQALAAALK